MKLWQLLKSHLGPYRNLLILVVFLQAVQTGASLTLPTINANLINNGVLTGDTDYIWREGAIMLFFSFVQIVFAGAAVYFGAKAAMGFGRDLRRDLFHQVTGVLGPRGRPVRRTVVDHPHHQRRPADPDARRARHHDDDRRHRSPW